jgi:C-terminal processing protease CtpA/Prc
VERIVPGFAAESSGRFEVGDIVLAIDGQDVEAYSLVEIKSLTIGTEGTSVSLDMLRPGGGEYSVTLQRRIPTFLDGSNVEATEVLVEP